MKTVAIIGAGSSGLPTIKSCLEEGLEPTCFELTDSVGGLWNYVDEDCPKRATVFRGVVMNTSKEITNYSDFPAPLEFPSFFPHGYMAKYCRLYAEHFDLISRILFKHEVLNIKPAVGESQKWTVQFMDLKSKVVAERIFDFVVVCNGHHCVPNYPSFPGQTNFKGIQLHSQQYRKPELFENKNVLVVGFGNSACDIAAECSTTAKEVFLSSRSKHWIFPRQYQNGLPYDTKFITRWNIFKNNFQTLDMISKEFENFASNRFDHTLYGVTPSTRFINHYPVANDVISYCILTGKVIIKDGVSSIMENSVIFENDKVKHEIDVIIYATGFDCVCPFLDNVLDLKNEIENIYQMIFPLCLQPVSSLAFVGLVDSNLYSNAAVFELQARYVARVFSGKCKLPSKAEMNEHTKKRSQRVKSILGPESRIPTFIEGLIYVEEISLAVGCNLKMWLLFFTDPKLFWACLRGPLLPSQFRLHGPNSWSGARNAILGFNQRLGYHMISSPRKESCGFSVKKCAIVLSTLSIGLFALHRFGFHDLKIQIQ